MVEHVGMNVDRRHAATTTAGGGHARHEAGRENGSVAKNRRSHRQIPAIHGVPPGGGVN